MQQSTFNPFLLHSNSNSSTGFPLGFSVAADGLILSAAVNC
jgi:hypothetical protein